MKIHEYQAKAILAKHGVPVPRGEVAFNATEAGEIARQLGFGIGLDGAQTNKFIRLVAALYDTFVATDATMIEINPLVITQGGDLLALDAKMNFDDNALYRHTDILDLRDLGEEDPLE